MFRYGCLVLLMTVCCSCVPADVELHRDKRVIGGDQYTKGEFPFHVSLWYMGKNNPFPSVNPDVHHICGGSLIGPSWVLTSMTCFDNGLLKGLGINAKWEIYVGMYAQTTAKDEAQYRKIAWVFRPQEYNLKSLYGDIALLKLNKPAQLSDTVGLAEVNSDPDCPKVGQEVEVIGWGQTQNTTYGPASDVPHKAVMKATSGKYCHDMYFKPEVLAVFGEDLRIDERNLCAGLPEGGVDACYGDLGSPLLAKCGNDDRNVIVGLVSYAYGCAKPDMPSVNTRVSAFHEWIIQTMNDNP